jgi:branched-chain amino acid aminotransferase
MDGKFLQWDDAKIHVLTHSLHYGGGVFEGIRFYEAENGKSAIFRLDEHIERLLFSAKTLEMDIPYSKDELKKIIIEIIKVNNIKSGYIRPIIFYGYGKMGLNPKGAQLNICIAVWPWGSYLGEDLVKVKTSSFMRIHPKTSETRAKITGHYSNSIMASLEAHREGYDEALLLDYEGNVAEGPGENIFIVKNGELHTPPEGNILVGITRSSVKRIASDNQIPLNEVTITLDELKSADEAFFTGTAAEVTGIRIVDDSTIGDGKFGAITELIKNIYTDVIHGKIDTYKEWLTYVE